MIRRSSAHAIISTPYLSDIRLLIKTSQLLASAELMGIKTSQHPQEYSLIQCSCVKGPSNLHVIDSSLVDSTPTASKAFSQ